MKYTYILFIFMLLYSCSGTKKVVQVTQPIKKEEVVEVKKNKSTDVKIDTMRLNDKSSTIIPPPISDNTDNIKGSVVNRTLALILPFKSSLGRVSSKENLSFLQYYGGIKLAAQKLEEEGIMLDIKVYDSEKITTKDLSTKLDLIIGPYATAANDANKTLFQNVVEYGKKNKILVASPFYSNSKTTENNPYYIQLKPNLREYLSRMVEHISKNFTPNEVTIILREGNVDLRWEEYIQEQAAAYYDKLQKNVFGKVIVKESALNDKNPLFTEGINKGKKVYILPNYSYNDENYVLQVLTKLNSEKTSKDIIVYGMPLILDSDKIGINLYNALQIRLVVPDFLERNNDRATVFTNSFFNAYKTIPSSFAFEGYDTMLFLGRAISQYGKDFPKQIGRDKATYLQTSYNVQAVYEDGDDSFTKLLFYENKHLEVIGFTNGRFRKI